MPLPIAAGALAARIAAHIAKSPTARKGLASAFKKFGKTTVKKEADKIPQIVRGRKIASSKKAADQLIKKENTSKIQGPRRFGKFGKSDTSTAKGRTGNNPKAQDKYRKDVETRKRPDRRSAAGKRGYNFND